MGADEICFLDITASSEKRDTILDIVRKPPTNVLFQHCGGGIRSIENIKNLLHAGAT